MKRFLFLLIILIFCNAGAAVAERLTVIKPVANIRSGPGANYDILGKVEKYYPIFVMKESDSWYYFRDFEDDRGWVHKSLVGKVPAVITKKDLCNIRSGPSTKEMRPDATRETPLVWLKRCANVSKVPISHIPEPRTARS